MSTDVPSFKRLVDPAARHFMHKPPAIAMGSATQWATCGDNDNSKNGPANLFMGPATFTTDLDVLAKKTTGGLGSHFDMLHQTPNCRGIAHMKDDWYWVFTTTTSLTSASPTSPAVTTTPTVRSTATRRAR